MFGGMILVLGELCGRRRMLTNVESLISVPILCLSLHSSSLNRAHLVAASGVVCRGDLVDLRTH